MKPPNFLQSPTAFCEFYMDHADRLQQVQAFVRSELARRFPGIAFAEKDQTELAEGLLMLVEQNTGGLRWGIRQAVEQIIHRRCDPIVNKEKQLTEPHEYSFKPVADRKPIRRGRARQLR